jgi:hypothetical protein
LGFHKKTGGTAMSFLKAKKSIVSLALVVAMGFAIAPALAQQAPGRTAPEPSAPEGEKSSAINPNCITANIRGCRPRLPMPRFASKESCSCKVNVIRSGGRNIQVKDCYGQLPDNTVHFCKNPFAQGQAG